MTDRRRFLSLMGIGAASAPLVAKEMADGQIAKQAGIDLARNMGSGSQLKGVSHDAQDRPDGKRRTPLNAWDEAAKYLARHGKLPDHVEEALRDEANEVSYLDYDIASKRSWSMAVKVQEQRQRNYGRILERYRHGSKSRAADKAFAALTGFDWPWY